MATKKADGSFGYTSDDAQQLHSIGFYQDGVLVKVASITYGNAAGQVEAGEATGDDDTGDGKDGE